MRFHHWTITALLVLTAAPTFGVKVDDAYFETHVRPVLAEHCYKCHSADAKKIKGGLRVDGRAMLLTGGDSGASIITGKPDESLLIKAVEYDDLELQMPPKHKLSGKQIKALRTWIEQGAPWPGDSANAKPDTAQTFTITDTDRNWWAFRPVQTPKAPAATDPAWNASAIDRFVYARLIANGLKPAPRADKHTLIRRAYFDLIGLPPTPEQINVFVRDDSPNAFAKVIDELLASPHYGERWARHWMDVVRYTETAGHVQDLPRPHAYKYRDYLIDAFNDDLPYNRFILEHLAGDLLPDARPGKRGEANVSPIATGFLWFHEMHFKPVDPELQRADQVDAQIDVVSKAFLGLTIACARCHDHKFDPVSQADYYALAGFFHSTKETHVRTALLKTLADPAIQEKADALQKQIEKVRLNGVNGTRRDMKAKTDAIVPVTEVNFGPGGINKLVQLRRQLRAINPSSAMWAPGAAEYEPRDIPLHVRGSHKNLGDPVRRRYLTLFDGLEAPEFSESSGRLWLAKRIADQDNPLTTRVMMNRLWHHHFGRGIVPTPNNFGRNAPKPTHPDLLDWLAHTFVRNKWSLKAMHREIMLSQTYRMASVNASSIAGERDPGNQWLHRQNVRRLEAEAVRDALLAVPGTLDRTIGGESVPPYLSPNVTANKPIHIPKSGPIDSNGRRSIYILVRRNFVTPFLKTFDFPDQGASAGTRDVTVVPNQALAMMNSPLVHLQAKRWAEGELKVKSSNKQRLKRMFLVSIGREPSKVERKEILAYLKANGENQETWQAIAHLLLNMNEFVFVR